MAFIHFDIETAPDEQRALARFDSAKVKLGNLKDADKIEAKVARAREDAVEKAALSPATGSIVAVGYSRGVGVDFIDGSEREILVSWWELFLEGATFVNWSGTQKSNFDRKWLIRRSWALGVPVPEAALEHSRWFSLSSRFLIGEEFSDRCSLENAARELGIPVEDTAPVSGKNFHRYFKGSEEERKAAEKYLAQDVLLVAALFEKMGCG